MVFDRALIEPENQDSFYVMLNPTKYTVEKGNQIAETGIPGLSAPILQYVHGNTRSLSAELVFDTYEKQTDVRLWTNKVYNLLAIDAHTHAPPICKVSWGDTSFRGVVDKVSGSFTLFLPNGTPVRARLNISVKEYIDVDQLVRVSPTQSADHRKSRVVKLGDTLTNIAYEEYGDAAKWRPIADANGLDDPLMLRPGRLLLIPAIDSGGQISRA